MVNKILYYGVIIPISLLPYFLLYGLSNFMYIVMYYLFGYRKKVIEGNIYGSFPNKTDKENKRIVKQFYKHFCDLVVESIKNFTISEKQAHKRMQVSNVEVIDKYHAQGKSVIVMGGHYGNWELMAVAIGLLTKHTQVGIYKPLSNTYFEIKMRESREKYGLVMLPMKQTKTFFDKKHDNPVSMIFGADQWPSNAIGAYWTTFMNRETPFLFGAEKYAKEYDYPVVYGEILKEKRGHYKVVFHDITDKPKDKEYGEIIESFITMLTKTINAKPENWLWSHKRWKRTKEEVFGEKK
jgi:KDO2-lipid IV(A) lauroyltransferase